MSLHANIKDIGAAFRQFKAQLDADVRKEQKIEELRNEFLDAGIPAHRAQAMAEEKYRLIHKAEK